jgi:hypothetical protein
MPVFLVKKEMASFVVLFRNIWLVRTATTFLLLSYSFINGICEIRTHFAILSTEISHQNGEIQSEKSTNK